MTGEMGEAGMGDRGWLPVLLRLLTDRETGRVCGMVTDIGGDIVDGVGVVDDEDDEDAVITWMDCVCEGEEMASGSFKEASVLGVVAVVVGEDGEGDGSIPVCDEELPDPACEPSPLGPPLTIPFTGVSTRGLSKAGGASCSSSNRCRRASWAATSASSP
jgi:hypothetical protein